MKKYRCIKECYGESYECRINDIIYLKSKNYQWVWIDKQCCNDNIHTWIFDQAFEEVIEPLKWEDVKVGDYIQQIDDEKVCIDKEDITYKQSTCSPWEVYKKVNGLIQLGDNGYLVHKDDIHHFKKD